MIISETKEKKMIFFALVSFLLICFLVINAYAYPKFVIHHSGTNKTLNRQIMQSIPEEVFFNVPSLEFRAGACYYKPVSELEVQGLYYLGSAKIVVCTADEQDYQRLRNILIHELRHHWGWDKYHSDETYVRFKFEEER